MRLLNALNKKACFDLTLVALVISAPAIGVGIVHILRYFGL